MTHEIQCQVSRVERESERDGNEKKKHNNDQVPFQMMLMSKSLLQHSMANAKSNEGYALHGRMHMQKR